MAKNMEGGPAGVSVAASPGLTEQELLALEAKYCSWGDTVHYLEPPKFFERCEGSTLYDREGTRGRVSVEGGEGSVTTRGGRGTLSTHGGRGTVSAHPGSH